MTRSRILAVVLLAGTSLLVGCTQPAPSHESAKSTLMTDAAASMAAFENEDPSLQSLLDRSVGYAIFPDVGKAGFIAGGSYGKGEVYEKDQKIGYADITQATVGLQAGAQTFDELTVFLQPKDFDDFKDNQLALAANLSAVIIKPGAAGTSDTSKGVVVFARPKGGLMAEASVGGQRFRFQTLAAAATQPVAATQPSEQ
jgi:lipid-binding SYLF domain-containing protein